MKTQIVDQIIRPKVEGGCEWINKRKVIVRLVRGSEPVKELWWCLGATGWAGRGCRDYYNATLTTAAKGQYTLGGASSITKEIAEGGKLSRRRIAELADKIDAFFGVPVSGMIEIQRTLIVEE